MLVHGSASSSFALLSRPEIQLVSNLRLQKSTSKKHFCLPVNIAAKRAIESLFSTDKTRECAEYKFVNLVCGRSSGGSSTLNRTQETISIKKPLTEKHKIGVYFIVCASSLPSWLYDIDVTHLPIFVQKSLLATNQESACSLGIF